MSEIEMRNKTLWDALRRHADISLPHRGRDYERTVLYSSRNGTSDNVSEDDIIEESLMYISRQGTATLSDDTEDIMEGVQEEKNVEWSAHSSLPSSHYGTLPTSKISLCWLAQRPEKREGGGDVCLGIMSLFFISLALFLFVFLFVNKVLLSPEAEAIREDDPRWHDQARKCQF
eukprot:jgi/Bigna1/77591/fgenesh1_pg.49_\